jgi:membrane-associated phospholipid phosphatase
VVRGGRRAGGDQGLVGGRPGRSGPLRPRGPGPGPCLAQSSAGLSLRGPYLVWVIVAAAAAGGSSRPAVAPGSAPRGRFPRRRGGAGRRGPVDGNAKQILQRPRPDLFAALVPAAPSWSLPSGHATQAMATALALALAATQLSPGCKSWAIPLACIVAILVGLSRVYLQVHFPSDVVAGWIAGACWVAGLRGFAPILRRTP